MPIPGGSIGPDGYDFERPYRQWKAQRDMFYDLRDVERGIYDPIRNVAEGGVLRVLENGLYGFPSVAASITVGTIPGFGTVGLYAMATDNAYSTIRRDIIAGGGDPAFASEVADAWAPSIGIIQAALEQLQISALIGRSPVGKVINTKITQFVTSQGVSPNNRTLTIVMRYGV